MEVLARKEGLPNGVSDVLLDLHDWVSKEYKAGRLGEEMREKDRPKFGIRQLRWCSPPSARSASGPATSRRASSCCEGVRSLGRDPRRQGCHR